MTIAQRLGLVRDVHLAVRIVQIIPLSHEWSQKIVGMKVSKLREWDIISNVLS